MPNDDGPTYVDVEGIEWWWDGSVWNCWVADQWVPAPGANPTGLVKVDTDAITPTCGRCGEEVLVDTLFCGSCGASLRELQDETPASRLAVPEQEMVVADPVNSSGLATDPFAWARKYCRNGHVVTVGASACGECGADTSFVVKKKPDPLYASKRNPVGQGVRPTLKPTMPPQRQGMPKNLVITLVVALVLLVGGGIGFAAAQSGGSGAPNQMAGGGGSTSRGPTSGQLDQAYQSGYRQGQLTSSVSSCHSSQYSDPQLSAQYQSGCGAGFSTVSQCASMQMSDPIAASDCRNAARRSG